MLVALLNHTTASFSCSTIGLDGLSCSHTKSLHLEQHPDLSGVWRTQWVSRTPGAPEEECWCAHRTWRESVNALQTCGHKPPEKRRLPEGPDPKADWVTKEKIRLARNASELLEGADSRTLTKEMSNDTLSDVTVQLTPQDHRLLQNIRPDILAMLQRMNAGSEGPAWTVVDADVQLADSIEARVAVKKQRLAERKAAMR